jgi:hypothetical protein
LQEVDGVQAGHQEKPEPHEEEDFLVEQVDPKTGEFIKSN